MVDFKKLAEDHYAAATPEERARMDAYRERESRYDLTRRDIVGNFTRYSGRNMSDGTTGRTKYETYPVRDWTASIRMRIEDGGHGGREYEILRFIGGPTGHEAYELSEEFIEVLQEKMPEGFEDRFSICGGNTNYDGCWVSCGNVLDYVREFRPEFFPATRVAPEVERPIPAFLRR